MHAPRWFWLSIAWLAASLLACGERDAPAPALSLSAPQTQVVAGDSLDVTATYEASTGSSQATDVTWSTSDAAVATVSSAADGHASVRGVAPGQATVRATGARGQLDELVVTVNPAVLRSLEITPPAPSLARGTQVVLAADGKFSDGTIRSLTTQVTWTTTAAATARIEGPGLVYGAGVGSATITATLGSVMATARVTVSSATLVSIAVTPTNPELPIGLTQQLTATGTFSDHTTQPLGASVVWTTDAPDAVSVAQTGVVTALAPGDAHVTATFGAMFGATTISVTPAVLAAIQVTPIQPSVPKGRTVRLVATGTFSDGTTKTLAGTLTWESSSPTVATISNDAATRGVVTTVGTGTTTMSATSGAIHGTTMLTVTAAELVSLAVSPKDSTITVGLAAQLRADGTFTDESTMNLTDQVVWSSSDPAVAAVSNTDGARGKATALGIGMTTITATSGTITQATTLTVTAAKLVRIDVTPVTPTQIPLGRIVSFTATGTFDNGDTLNLTDEVDWESSAPTVATISNATGSHGSLTAILVGTTTISASSRGVTGTTDVTVTDAVIDQLTVAPPTASVFPGATQQYTATAKLSDGSTADVTTAVTWSSLDGSIAQVSNAAPTQGQATAIAPGATSITATSGPVHGSATLIVRGLAVSATLPRAGLTGVRAITPVAITFKQPIAPATLTVQPATGSCSESLQLSPDNFATCVGFAGLTLDATSTIATATPAAALTARATYQLRVLGTVATASGAAMGADFTQLPGFTVADGACASGLVISQVFGGGGLGGANGYRFDFIELHNGGATPVDLSGFALQSSALALTGAWNPQALPARTIPPGGYFLIQESGTTTGIDLPTPDFVPPTAPFSINGVSHKIAITPTTAAIPATTTAACTSSPATALATTLDALGYGIANCHEGPALGALSNTTSAQRKNDGCSDSDNNAADFTIAAPTPRNSATPPVSCTCP